MEATVAAWRKKGAPTKSDEGLREWLLSRRRDAKARRDAVRESVVQLYEKQFGAKAIAKTLGIGPDVARTMLIEAGVYQRLKEFCGGRANDDDITYVVIKFAG